MSKSQNSAIGTIYTGVLPTFKILRGAYPLASRLIFVDDLTPLELVP